MKTIELFDDEFSEKFEGDLSLIPEFFFYENNAMVEMASTLKVLTNAKSVLILQDARTKAATDAKAIAVFSDVGFNTAEFLIPDKEDGTFPVCDDLTKNSIQRQLPETDLFVAIGSGVINDLTKWIAAEAGKPYAVFATAASMNGYAAANVAPMINGLKTLFKAKAPLVVAASPEVIRNAPWHLTASGLGDVIAKPVSTTDWQINNFLFGENYSESIAGIINHIEPSYVNNASRLAEKDPEAIKALFKALILSGCAMTLIGSSMPASGGEHLISHTLDIRAHIEKKTHDLHGRQVGIGTIFAAALYQRVLEIEKPILNSDPLKFAGEYWKEIADEAKKQYGLASAKISRSASILKDASKWNHLKTIVESTLRNPQTIKDCLVSANAANTLDDIGSTKSEFKNAVLNCACMRERFTSIDLAFLLGILPDAVDEIIEEYL